LSIKTAVIYLAPVVSCQCWQGIRDMLGHDVHTLLSVQWAGFLSLCILEHKSQRELCADLPMGALGA